ncbi:hypothetical protein DPMN_122897, partial [Dreissena polymorpha]
FINDNDTNRNAAVQQLLDKAQKDTINAAWMQDPTAHDVFVRNTYTAPPPGGHVFPPIWTIFELVRDINKTNVLNKFHDDWAKIVTSRAQRTKGDHKSDRKINVTSRVLT